MLFLVLPLLLLPQVMSKAVRCRMLDGVAQGQEKDFNPRFLCAVEEAEPEPAAKKPCTAAELFGPMM